VIYILAINGLVLPR